MTKTKTKKTNVKVKSYTRKDGTRVRASQRSVETNNIRNTYELQRRRKGKELLRDIGSDLTLGLIKPSEITRKRTSVRKAQAAGVLLNRVDRRGLAEATKAATNDYQINPNSKKALAEINRLENRSKIAGIKPERYRKLAALYEKEMEKGGYQGMKYRGTDFTNTNTRIEFGRGKDKKKRKRRGTAFDAGVATGAALAGGIGTFKASTFRDRQNFDLQAQSNPDEVLNRARNNPLNKQRFAEYDSVNENLGASQKAKDKLESLSRQIDDQDVSPKMAQKAKAKLAAKYGKDIGDIPALSKQLSQSRNKIISNERLRSVDKLKAGRRALAGAAIAGAGGYALNRVIRRRRENKK